MHEVIRQNIFRKHLTRGDQWVADVHSDDVSTAFRIWRESDKSGHLVIELGNAHVRLGQDHLDEVDGGCKEGPLLVHLLQIRGVTLRTTLSFSGDHLVSLHRFCP